MAQIDGTPEADTLTGTAADDSISGGGGSDRLDGGGGRDSFLGGDGNDVITATLATAWIEGGEGNDFLILRALAAGETLASGAVYRGGAGDDSFTGPRTVFGTRGLTLDGGDGRDSVAITGDAPADTATRLDLYLDQPSPTGDGATLRGFEAFSFGIPVSFHGSDTAETIGASSFTDIVLGGGGNDNITGDPDVYDRGVPVDRGGDDTLMGGTGDDTIIEYTGANYVRGDEGNDWLQGGMRFDDLNGNMGNDTVRGGAGDDWVVGGKDQDQLFGDAGDDLVYGNLGDDTCQGGGGADIVRGGQGDDVLSGGDGADFIAGDLGSDTLSGGAGADIFHTHASTGLDRVTDFNAAEGDRVNLLPGTAYALSQQGADVLIDMGGGGRMILVGVTLSNLPNGWIFGAS